MGSEVGYLFPTKPYDRDRCHGLVTSGHKTITSYNDFTQKLMERFDKRDPEIHFRELAQLKQIDSAEAFISEF